MPDDDVPKLADWLAEYRSRPEPIEVIVASYDLIVPIPIMPEAGSAAGQVGLDIVRYDKPGWPGPPDEGHYIMGVDAHGAHLWDDWYDSELAAREVIDDGHYGAVKERAPRQGTAAES